MDDLLKGDNHLPRTGFPIIRFLFATLLTLPVLLYVLLVTVVKDFFIGGDTMTSLVLEVPCRTGAACSIKDGRRCCCRAVHRLQGGLGQRCARSPLYSPRPGHLHRSRLEISNRLSNLAVSIWIPHGAYPGWGPILLNRKPRQIIILGAGLDTRAHRLNLPPTSRFYEIDIATTQALKRKAAREHPNEFRQDVKYVPVDFSHERFVDKLKEAAPEFDMADADTVILFEGVCMYLQWEALKATMEMISDNFAPGTIVAMDILDNVFSKKATRALNPKVAEFKHLALTVERIGEPFQWGIPDGETVDSVFSKLGFEIVVDATTKDIQRMFLKPQGGSRPFGRIPGFAHYVVLKVADRKKS